MNRKVLISLIVIFLMLMTVGIIQQAHGTITAKPEISNILCLLKWKDVEATIPCVPVANGEEAIVSAEIIKARFLTDQEAERETGVAYYDLFYRIDDRQPIGFMVMKLVGINKRAKAYWAGAEVEASYWLYYHSTSSVLPTEVTEELFWAAMDFY